MTGPGDLSHHERRMAATDATEARPLAALIAVDLPEPAEYAAAMLALHPWLAQTLIEARKTSRGYRLRLETGNRYLAALRSLGLADVPGDNPSPESRGMARGFYLNNFGAAVRRELVILTRGGRELMGEDEL
jgi:hypothetical protein